MKKFSEPPHNDPSNRRSHSKSQKSPFGAIDKLQSPPAEIGDSKNPFPAPGRGNHEIPSPQIGNLEISSVEIDHFRNPFSEIDNEGNSSAEIDELENPSPKIDNLENPFAETHGSAASPSRSYSLWSAIVNRTLAVFENRSACGADCRPRGGARLRWNAALRRAVAVDPMRRLQERLLGCRWGPSPLPSKHSIWLLGVCYTLSDSGDPTVSSDAYRDFQADIGSRIWITYRKGFEAIGPTKLTTDVGWGCMIRSGQMLLAQALICHYLGRTWRRSSPESSLRGYLEVLQCFGDSSSQTCPYSIHNILATGGHYGLVAGSWLGPYAMCRSLEALACSGKACSKMEKFKAAFPMVIHVVSGDGEGERGGAPCICVDVVAELCSNWGDVAGTWSALLLLVPLVLGLNKVNPRYLPLLAATVSFPQSLGIMGGKPGASTYLVGVQGNEVFYLDPHQVQQVCLVSPDNPKADTSTYHCSNVRQMSLSAIDPSLALGFYCRDRDDFEDLCERVLELERQANGAPMFTVEKSSDDNGLHKEKLYMKKCAHKEPVPLTVDFYSSDEGWQIL